ncbi:MAG: ribonuclease D [Phycisphaerales bacterium]|nr:ribonuclease D [Phycisphaerales bacterium]
MTQPPEIVIDQKRLDSLCEQWRAQGRFVFDTEFIRDETYDAALCLIQVTTGENVILIDPTVGLDVAVFWSLVTDPNVVTIVHAGKEDFDVCLRMTGEPPRNVFDVQIAAGLVGLHYPLSLTRLVEQMLQKRIAKGQTMTDWLRRPLTEDQIRYAVEDVVYLPRIYELLVTELRRRGRESWAHEEFRRFEDPQFYKPPVQERAYKLKGTTRLDGVGLAVLTKLIEWRERWAKEKNRPIRALIRDDVLVEIARRRPTDAGSIQVLRGFPQSKNPKIVREVLDLVKAGMATPRSEQPPVVEIREESPMEKAMVDLLSAVVRAICFEEGIATELLGTTQRIREFLDAANAQKTDAVLMAGWRGEFIGRRLSDLLAGRSEIHLSGWPDHPELAVVAHGGNQSSQHGDRDCRHCAG